jgi:hypothetical protein
MERRSDPERDGRGEVLRGCFAIAGHPNASKLGGLVTYADAIVDGEEDDVRTDALSGRMDA